MTIMSIEPVSTKSMAFASRLTDLLRKRWVIILVVPAVIILVIIVLTFYASIVEWIFTKPTRPPDFREEDDDLRRNEVIIDEVEKRITDEIEAKAGKLKDGIDAGDPSPAEIFNEELNEELKKRTL